MIRVQIFDSDDLKNLENIKCRCEASICAQHVVDYTYSDEVYECAKDLINKIKTKIL